MNRTLALILLLPPIAFAIGVSHAQTPMVIIASRFTAPVATATVTTPTASDSTSLASVIKLLHEMKATNAETLKKQEAALQQLDEMQKAADQIKAFSERG